MVSILQLMRKKHKINPFKLEDDIDSFMKGFQIFCNMDNLSDNEKAKDLLKSLDQKVLDIIYRELSEEEMRNYVTLKQHLLERFQIKKSAGLRRFEFGKVKREVGETHEEYYSRLLGLANKAFVEDSTQTIDRNILDQFVIGNDNRTRTYLLEKDPKTAKEALTLAISFQAAHSYNEAVKDKTEALTVSNSDFDRKAGNGRTIVRARYDDYDNKQYRYKDRDIDNNRERYRDTSQDRYRDCNQERYRKDSRDRYRDSSRDRYSDSNRDRYSNSNRERHGSNYRSQQSNNYRDRDNNNGRDRNQERYNSFSSRGSYSNRRHDPGHGHRGAYRFNNVDRRGDGFTGQRRGFGIQRSDTRELTDNHVNASSELQYVMALFNDVEVPMLVDTGSAVTLINEEVWKVLKINEPLEPVPFAVSSVNNHQIDILGKKVIRFSLKSKARYRASRFFYFNVFVARNLAKEAIIGIDFLRRFQAKIDTRSAKLTLIKDGVLSAHSLFGRIGTRCVTANFISSTFRENFSKEHPTTPIINTHTLDLIGIDIIGPLPTSNRRNHFIYNNKTRAHNVNFSIPVNNNKLQEQQIKKNQLTRQRVTTMAPTSKTPTATLPSKTLANVTVIPAIQPKDEPVFQPMRQRQAAVLS
jgi:hypothetical protein